MGKPVIPELEPQSSKRSGINEHSTLIRGGLKEKAKPSIVQDQCLENSEQGDDQLMRLSQPVQPRFSAETLRTLLKSVHLTQSSQPLEGYEQELLAMTRRWQDEFGQPEPNLTAFSNYHSLLRLSKFTGAHPKLLDDLAEYKQFVVGDVEETEKHYCMVQDLLWVVSSLAAKFKLSKTHFFNYRLTDRALNVKILDLTRMNENFYTTETLWFALTHGEVPLSTYLSFAGSQYAQVLISLSEKLFKALLSINWSSSLTATPLPNTPATPNKLPSKNVDPKSLKVRSKLFRCFGQKPEEEKAVQLRVLIAEFDQVYRLFEREVIAAFVS